jgi:hypothetical protein
MVAIAAGLGVNGKIAFTPLTLFFLRAKTGKLSVQLSPTTSQTLKLPDITAEF